MIKSTIDEKLGHSSAATRLGRVLSLSIEVFFDRIANWIDHGFMGNSMLKFRFIGD